MILINRTSSHRYMAPRSGVKPLWGSGQSACVFPHLAPAMVLALIGLALQEKNARLLGAAQQLFGHCQAQKEEIKRLFQQKLDEVDWSLPGYRGALHMTPSAELWAGGWAGR